MQQSGEVDQGPEMPLSGALREKNAQNVGESILIKRENQLNPILDFMANASLDTSGSPCNGINAPRHIDLDDMISRLLDAGCSTKITKTVCLKNAEISTICSASQELLLSQPALLELSAPLKIVGDIHGQYLDLIRLFEMCGFPPASNYLFLGDYVNRGKQGLETILLLLCYKLKYPENFFLLRGNHECANVTRVYGFYDECKRRCNIKTWKSFIDTFNCLPIASIVAGKIFCVHGGLSPNLSHMDDIRGIARPTDVPDYGLLNDLLWSDPADMEEDWEPNERGVSYSFGKKVVRNFLQRHDFDLVCRAHMVVEDGYEFYQDRALVTVFSAPNYCGEFDNWGAIMSVSVDLLCSFELLKPLGSTALKNHLMEGRKKRKSILSSRDYRQYQSNDGASIMDCKLNNILENDFEHGNERASSDQMSTVTSEAVPSNGLQVAVDAQRLPEPSLISLHGLAGDLFKAILGLYIVITQQASQTKHSRRLHSELERFFLWGEGLSVSDGQLDDTLSKYPELRHTVLSTLYELGKVIKDDLLRVIGGTTHSEEYGSSAEFVLTDLAQSDMTRELQRLLKNAATVSIVPKARADFESGSDDGFTRDDLDEILDDLATYIDCLMDLSLALESPIVDLESSSFQ